MPAPRLDTDRARTKLQAFHFSGLFIEELGWHQPASRKPVPIEYDGARWRAVEVSQLSGFRVFEITPEDRATPLPDAKAQQELWQRVALHSVENILIFVDAARTQSLWLWMKREVKRFLPRRHHFLRGQPGDLFLSKLAALFVDLSELDEDGNLDITAATGRVRKALDVETVTKVFFREFQDEHGRLLGQIHGIPDARERRWYASVLLNRLMFVWFLQAKGFLDGGNRDYLPDLLAASEKKARGHFFSHVLRDLFFEGFAKPSGRRQCVGPVPLGDIPYLNGGLFLPHGIEQRIEGDALLTAPYEKIRIADAAFADLFALFRRYSWSLNDTPGGDDREINPDVLGYIFEKYINQKEFGAYYTRPEITEYLCEQTIHQLVLDRANANFDAAQTLHQRDPKAFPAPRRFTALDDLLFHADGPLCARLLLDVLPRLSLLDPACGSGAFLVAAQKTLLNLYTALLGRCEALGHRPVLDWMERQKREHKAPAAYWLKKKIVTENLYGVDIMEEAVEIAKLRLFLSLVASAEKRDQLEPLPNIEFNLLAGNSLIGLLHVDSAAFDQGGATFLSPTPSPSASQGRQECRPSHGQHRMTLTHTPAKDELAMTVESTTAPTRQEKVGAHLAVVRAAKYRELLDEKNRLIALYKEAPNQLGAGVKDSDVLVSLRRSIEEKKAAAREVLDRLLLAEFQRLGIQFHQATWISEAPENASTPAASAASAPKERNKPAQGNALGSHPKNDLALKGRSIPGGKDGKPEKRTLKLDDIRALQPFHWAYEFDDILINRGGFDAIITNPPWEIFKPQAKAFFNEYSEVVSKNNMTIKEFEKEQARLLKLPGVMAAWLAFLSRFPHVSAYIRGCEDYCHQMSVVNGKRTGADINLYKLFVERSYRFLRDGGICGIVIPGNITTDFGAKGLRELLFSEATIERLLVLSNERYIFDGIHHDTQFCLLSFIKGGQTDVLKMACRLDVREAVSPGQLDSFLHSDDVLLDIPIELIRQLSPDALAIMDFRNETDISIAKALLNFPVAGATIEGRWKLELCREFDMTNDSDLFTQQRDTGDLPLYEGKMFHQFDAKWKEPKYWLNERAAAARLMSSRMKRIAQFAKKAGIEFVKPKLVRLDYTTYRLAFRDVGPATNARSMIVTVLPPGVFCPHTTSLEEVFYAAVVGGRLEPNCTHLSMHERLYLCAVLNSFAVDSWLRRSVTKHVSFFHVYSTPIPRLTSADAAFRPLVERAARLVGTSAEFDDLLREVFGPAATHRTHGATAAADRQRLRAEMDALVARLYALTEEEFTHILATFPLVDAAVRAATLEAFRAATRGEIA